MLGVRALFASSLPQTAFGRPEALTELVPYQAYYSTVSILILALAGIITPGAALPRPPRPRARPLLLDRGVAARVPGGASFGSALGTLLLTTLAPVLFLFAGNILFAVHPLGYLQDHWRDLPRIVAAGFVIASYYAAIGLAVSSLTSRRAFAMGGMLALLVASGTTSAILSGLGADAKALLLALPVIPMILSQRMFPDAAGRPGDRRPGRGSLRTWSWSACRSRSCCSATGGPTVTDAIVVDGVARWFRDRVAVADVSFAAGPGVTGLLGHNGAGKTTMLRLLAGFTSPSRGTVRILDADPRREPEVFRRVGLVPDGDGLWPFLTAHGAVALLARLRGVPDPDAAAHRALATVGLDEVGERRLAGLLEGHAAGREARAGARPRPRRAAARRAAERPRPGPPPCVRRARAAPRRDRARP